MPTPIANGETALEPAGAAVSGAVYDEVGVGYTRGRRADPRSRSSTEGVAA